MIRLLGFLIAFLVFTLPGRAQQPVDLHLVLAIDVSSSIDYREFNLEVDGYTQAFRHPDVLRAIQSGPHGRIAVTVMQWAGRYQQRVATDWTVIGGAAEADRMASEFTNMPRLFEGATALGEAVLFAIDLFDKAPGPAPRRIIDVSGDGMSNEGQVASFGRDTAARRGITINGLAIVNEEKDLEEFYRQFLITGPAAFVMVARDFESFAEAIVRKLVREITGELVSESEPSYPDDARAVGALAHRTGP